MKKLVLSLILLASCSTQRDDLERSAYVSFHDIATDLRAYVAQNDTISEARAIAIKIAETTGEDPNKYRAIPVLTDLQVQALQLKLDAFDRLVAERLREDTSK